jgi:hypothetical protein
LSRKAELDSIQLSSLSFPDFFKSDFPATARTITLFDVRFCRLGLFSQSSGNIIFHSLKNCGL